MPSIEVLKRKCTSLFEPDDRLKIQEAVVTCHHILSEATHLLKAFYLSQYEERYHDDGNNVVDDQYALIVDDGMLKSCCDIVQGVTKDTSRKTKEKPTESMTEEQKENQAKLDEKKATKKSNQKSVFAKIVACYGTWFTDQQPITHKLSLSHILSYSIEQTMTAYGNNIWMNYPKYVKKYIYCWLLCRKGIANNDPVTRKQAAQLTSHILYSTTLPSTTEPIPYNTIDIEELTRLLVPVKSTKPKQASNRLYDTKARPWVYLQRMVWINRRLETSFMDLKPKIRRLCSPISIITTLIPNHIRIDTSGLTQLLMTKDRIELFKAFYASTFKMDLDINTKADMLKTYSKVAKKSKDEVTDKDGATYATRYWRYLCRFNNHKNVLKTKRNDGSVWVFDNAILTDGCSVCFQIVKEEDFKRKNRFDQKPMTKKDTEEDDLMEFTHLKDCKSWWQQVDEQNDCRTASCDPGKSDIMALTDGIRTMRYTKAQRNHDTLSKTRSIHSKKLRTDAIVQGVYGTLVNPTVHDYETEFMSETCKKTCFLNGFRLYWERRRVLTTQGLYKHPFFRQAKYLVYTKIKSSEQIFFNKVKGVFLPACSADKVPKWMTKSDDPTIKWIIHRAMTPTKHIKIGWGNWGRNPNLKNNAPTPGIGIRRRAEKVFGKRSTITVPEEYTSKTCPCCKTITLDNPVVGNAHIKKHHLLRCTNNDGHCRCRWWNRNVAGGINILTRFIDALAPAS